MWVGLRSVEVGGTWDWGQQVALSLGVGGKSTSVLGLSPELQDYRIIREGQGTNCTQCSALARCFTAGISTYLCIFVGSIRVEFV